MKKRLLLSGLLVLGFSAQVFAGGPAGHDHGGGESAPLMSSDPCADMPPMMTPPLGGQGGFTSAPLAADGQTALMQTPQEGMAPPPPTGAPSLMQSPPQGLMQSPPEGMAMPQGMMECPPLQAPALQKPVQRY